MPNNFEEFPSPLRNNLRKLFATMSHVQQEIAKFSTLLANSRQDFKQSIEDFFQQQNPFPIQEGKIEDDIEQYTRLVSYCLDAGDSEILDRWGIQAIRSNPVHMLASDNYGLYHLAFNEARKRSETPLEEECWIKIIELFQIFQNPGGTVAVITRG
jgi:hypothetical protein